MGRANRRQVVLGYRRKTAKPESMNELVRETAFHQTAVLYSFCLQIFVLSSCPVSVIDCNSKL